MFDRHTYVYLGVQNVQNKIAVYDNITLGNINYTEIK